MQTSPSCNCCTPLPHECIVFLEHLEDVSEECSGIWVLHDVDDLRTSSADAFIHSDLEATGPWRATLAGGIDGTGFATRRIRLTVGSDCDNYVFVEYHQFDNGGLAAKGYHLGVRSGGTDTYLSDSLIDGDPGGSAGPDGPFSLGMCWKGDGTLTGGPGEDPGRLQANGVSPPGGKVGIATVDLDTASLAFDGILLEESETEENEGCEECPDNCCDGNAPDEMNVIINASGTVTLSFNRTFDCGQLAGTHVVTRLSPGGHGTCIWEKTFTTIVVEGGTPTNYTTKIRLHNTDINDLPTVRITHVTGGVPLIVFETDTDVSGGTEVPCDEWDGDQIPFRTLAGPTGGHCKAGATCEVSA